MDVQDYMEIQPEEKYVFIWLSLQKMRLQIFNNLNIFYLSYLQKKN